MTPDTLLATRRLLVLHAITARCLAAIDADIDQARRAHSAASGLCVPMRDEAFRAAVREGRA